MDEQEKKAGRHHRRKYSTMLQRMLLLAAETQWFHHSQTSPIELEYIIYLNIRKTENVENQFGDLFMFINRGLAGKSKFNLHISERFAKFVRGAIFWKRDIYKIVDPRKRTSG